MKQEEIQIDEAQCLEIANDMGHHIEGLTLPQVFCVLATLVLEVVRNAEEQGVDVRAVVCEWLHVLIQHVLCIDDDEEEQIAN